MFLVISIDLLPFLLQPQPFPLYNLILIMADSCDLSLVKGFRESMTAVGLQITFCIVTLLCYIYNIVMIVCQSYYLRHNSTIKARKYKTMMLDVSKLSAMIASALGLVFVFAGVSLWPQSIEAAAIATGVFSQLSAIVWQGDHSKHLIKEMVERIPDIFAVIVAILTLQFLGMAYTDKTMNTFSRMHDPLDQCILSYILTGVSLLLGLVRKFFPRHDKMMLILFPIMQVLFFSFTTFFAVSTVAKGCKTFNISKIIAMVTLALGLVYSMTMCVFDLWKHKFNPNQAVQANAPAPAQLGQVNILAGTNGSSVASVPNNVHRHDTESEPNISDHEDQVVKEV